MKATTRDLHICHLCFDTLLVCENHQDRVWADGGVTRWMASKGCACGAGAPCKCKGFAVLGRDLLDAAGFYDWRIEWHPDGPSTCVHYRKTIDMWGKVLGNPWYIKEAIIHEMAHIEQGPKEMDYNGGHGTAFFKRFGRLLIDLAEVGS